MIMLANTVLITGFSQGIEKATALEFAKNKWNVIITFNKNIKLAKKTAEECKEIGANNVMMLQLNVLDNKSINNCSKDIIKRFKKIDVLVNNAGIVHIGLFKGSSIKNIEEELRTNLEGLIKVTLTLLPHISSSIINVSSQYGKEVDSEVAVYCASKFGVRGFTQALALEHPNLQIISLNPGLTATAMTNFAGLPAEKVGKLIFKSATKEYKVKNGGDIDVWKIYNN